MTAPAGTKAAARSFEPGFPGRFQRILHHCLQGAVPNGGDAEGTDLAVCLGDVDPFEGQRPPRLVETQLIDQLSACRWGLDHDLVHAWSVFAVIELRHPSHRLRPIGVAAQHELLETGDRPVVSLLRCPKDPSSQIAHPPIDLPPVDGLPVGGRRRSICKGCLHRTSPSMSVPNHGLWANHPIHVSSLAGWVLPCPAGYEFPVPCGCRPSLLGSSSPHWRSGPSLRVAD